MTKTDKVINRSKSTRTGRIRKKYLITDPDGRFFQGFTEYIPEIVHAFGEDEDFAYKTYSLEEAKEVLSRAYDRLYEFNGQRKVPEGYLKIVEMTFTECNQ